LDNLLFYILLIIMQPLTIGCRQPHIGCRQPIYGIYINVTGGRSGQIKSNQKAANLCVDVPAFSRWEIHTFRSNYNDYKKTPRRIGVFFVLLIT